MPKFLDSLPMILSRSLDRVMPSYRRLFQANDLTDQQWRVLRALWEKQHLTSAQITSLGACALRKIAVIYISSPPKKAGL